jgi:hypothetical protein
MDVFSCTSSPYRPAIRGPVYAPAARADIMAGRPAATTIPDFGNPFGPPPELSYDLCITSKTASGVEGHDYFPGHNSLAVYINDNSRLMCDPMLQTLGKWPDQDDGFFGRVFDNFVPESDASDVLLNHPPDAPNPEVYPFTYCQPITADGYHELMDYAGNAGDYQLWNGACTGFAVDGFNIGTGTTTFGDRGVVGYPSDIGSQIVEANGGERREPSFFGTLANTIADSGKSFWNSVTGSVSSAWSTLTSWF